jgi:hypothetical protein
MKLRIVTLLGICALGAAASGGCSHGTSPLDGNWVFDEVSSSGVMITVLYAFKSDGTFKYSVLAYPGCTGSLSYTGLTWSATSTQISLSGTNACSGSITCTSSGNVQNATCADFGNGLPTGAEATYELSADGNTLTLTDVMGDGGISGASILTRQ